MDNCQLPKCYPTTLNFENNAPINTMMPEVIPEAYEIQEYDNPSGLSQKISNSSSQPIGDCVGPHVNTPGPLDQPLLVEHKENKNIKVINAIEKNSINNKFLISCLIIILIAFICYIKKPY
jgi:hypothetical protein